MSMELYMFVNAICFLLSIGVMYFFVTFASKFFHFNEKIKNMGYISSAVLLVLSVLIIH